MGGPADNFCIPLHRRTDPPMTAQVPAFPGTREQTPGMMIFRVATQRENGRAPGRK